MANPQVRVGVGVFILASSNELANNPRFLVGKRMNSHGAGTYALPGGHLEFGETPEECAARETLEETGLKISPAQFLTATNDYMPAENKHYITMFTICVREKDSDEPQVLEPEKCEGWDWVSWEELMDWVKVESEAEEDEVLERKLFLPLLNLTHATYANVKMPLGWERINNKKSTPNKNIVFIKPRAGPDEAISKDYLERIAAQCLPIMNRNYLAVASLEEYEPNLEFWGRNFNNGEIIQLVLKSPSTGRWLPFKFVQMVMMHELAHCKEMNHGPGFWKVRNGYASEMKELWAKDYTGDGLWGKGVLLENGMFTRDTLDEGEILPEHMCGGTFKSRGRKKRKAKPKITYKEQKERRIRKKFGVNGTTLGADDKVKVKLENGKKPVGKPRIAGSARGRELRAAAALARFEVKKEEPQIKDEELVTDSETESEDEVHIKAEPDDAVDIDGSRLVDSKGHGMVRVCDDEDKDDDNVKNELRELQSMHSQAQLSQSTKVDSQPKAAVSSIPQSSKPTKSSDLSTNSRGSKPSKTIGKRILQDTGQGSGSSSSKPKLTENVPPTIMSKISVSPVEASCPVCSVINNPMSLTCTVCSNVLKPDFVPNAWKCNSATCKGGEYINAGDVGLCGVCGNRKS
ncbi:DNA-dependent metalloprotease WSS1-like protein [Lachnellula hyalina]|uniref:DNA-dependent metalloprotease WSS1-like protein n=1 Tax=Lachnellula hyalina TaxID=1316788 RepID=A0A8H8R5B9_9HELO|nr:DNA-dependent metalloprotease WSS1-like protein [Lachnellula hyalina]TVY27921.1 DNA-dependent metalloprotease WSS1-like protein [Lachnellula hyalina]